MSKIDRFCEFLMTTIIPGVIFSGWILLFLFGIVAAIIKAIVLGLF